MYSHSLIDISHGEPDFVLFSDASLTGWGCSCEHGTTGGHWDSTEVAVSINASELKEGLFAFQVFTRDKYSLRACLIWAIPLLLHVQIRWVPVIQIHATVLQSKSVNSALLEIDGFQQLMCLV